MHPWRAIKREHFMFKSVAEITDEYFKSLLDQTPIGKPDWKLLRKKLIADRRNRVIVQKHTTLCTSTHATQNTMWDFERKDQMGILLMLAQRLVGHHDAFICAAQLHTAQDELQEHVREVEQARAPRRLRQERASRLSCALH